MLFHLMFLGKEIKDELRNHKNVFTNNTEILYNTKTLYNTKILKFFCIWTELQ